MGVRASCSPTARSNVPVFTPPIGFLSSGDKSPGVIHVYSDSVRLAQLGLWLVFFSRLLALSLFPHSVSVSVSYYAGDFSWLLDCARPSLSVSRCAGTVTARQLIP